MCNNLEKQKRAKLTIYTIYRRGTSDSVTDFSVFSNPVDAQNVSCLGLCGSEICPKISA